MKNYWDFLSDDLKIHIYAIRLQTYIKIFLKKIHNKKLMQYLEMKAIRESINDPWWDYFDPIYYYRLV